MTYQIEENLTTNLISPVHKNQTGQKGQYNKTKLAQSEDWP